VVGEVGNADVDGNDGQHSTTSDRFEVKGVVGEPKSSHYLSVLMRHVQSGHFPGYSRTVYLRWKWGNATRVELSSITARGGFLWHRDCENGMV